MRRPSTRPQRDPGYIKGYPPGLRENGGQYSHAAMWSILAFARLGDGARAAGLFALLNPINHALAPAPTERYKVEPYVVAADVYSVAPHVGRGGWTWYTGAAGWMYRAGIEGILGIRREGAILVIDPCIPPEWPGYDATLNVGDTRYDIRVVAPSEALPRCFERAAGWRSLARFRSEGPRAAGRRKSHPAARDAVRLLLKFASEQTAPRRARMLCL